VRGIEGAGERHTEREREREGERERERESEREGAYDMTDTPAKVRAPRSAQAKIR